MAKITAISHNLVTIETNQKDMAQFVKLHRHEPGFVIQHDNILRNVAYSSGQEAINSLLFGEVGGYTAFSGTVQLVTIIES